MAATGRRGKVFGLLGVVLALGAGIWLYQNASLTRLRRDFEPWMHRLERWRDAIEEARREFEESVRDLISLYFGKDGFSVLEAKDGKEALWQFEKEKPQVVVLDIRLPTMDGIETLNALLGKDRQAQVILNTAHPQYKENFMTWGAAAYVMKSSDLGELKEKIREVLEKQKTR